MARRRNRAVSSGGISFYMDSDTLTPSIRKIPEFVDKAVRTTMRYYEPQVENYARLHAPWTDRTSNARNGLIARSGKEGDNHFIVLAHRVPYGIFLETRWSGKYAIIVPTIAEYGPRVMKTIEGILDRMEATR